MEKISIIIITYNRALDLLELLKDISELENADELLEDVVIFNNNSSESYKAVQAFIEQKTGIPWQYVVSDKNLGVSAGRNKAIQLAQGQLLFLIDDDVLIPDKETLKKINLFFSSKFSADNHVATLTPLIFYFDTGEIQQTAFPHKKFSKYRHQDEFLTSYYVGAAHILRKEVLAKTGLLSEDFFYGMEEYDLSYRMIREGYALAFSNTIKIIHKESPLGRIPKKEKLLMMWQNKTKVAKRHLPRLYMYSTFFMWSFFYLAKSGFDWKGWISGIKKIPAMTAKEKRNPVTKNYLMYLKKTEARLWY